MPRFFNRIRKQLAKENKFLQYSRYAIGEILLVVIGILIALQIDNWNDERKDRINEREVLSSLLEDFNANDSILDTSLINIKKQINNWTIVIDMVNTPESEVDASPENKRRVVNTSYVKSNIITGTLSSVLSSDKLELLSDLKLKKLLTAYPSYIDGYREVESHLRDYVINIQRPMVRSYISLGDLWLDSREYEVYHNKIPPSDFDGILSNREYLNIVLGILATDRALLEQANLLHSKTREIRELLKKNLTK